MNEITSKIEIQRIIEKAQSDILKITGVNIKLMINERKSKDEEKWILKNIVCSYFGYSWDEICSKKGKRREISDAMHVFMWIAVKQLFCSKREVSEFCNRDRTSYLAAEKKIEGFYEVKDMLCFDIDEITIRLKQELLSRSKLLNDENKN